jgi:hypothetical protein
MLSFIYALIGRHPLVLELIMVFLGCYVVKLIYKASLLLWEDYSIARTAAWFGALFFNLILHSALILREIPVNVFLLLSIIAFIKYWKYSIKGQFIWFVIYGFLATMFHSGILFIFLGFLIFNFVFKKSSDKIKKSFSQKIMMPLVIIGIILLVNSLGLGLSKFGGSLEEMSDQFNKMESLKTRGNSAYPNWMTLSGGFNDIWKAPIRYVAFLFSPFIPFLVKSDGHLIGLIDAFLYLFLLNRIFKNRISLKNNSTARGILVISLTLVLVFSLGVTNVGTAIRHRAKIAPLFIILLLPKRNNVNGISNYQV